MKSNFKKLHVPEGLIVADISKFTNKINSFRTLGANNLHAILDFDRTLTVKRPGSNDEVTTWHIMNEHLPAAAQAQYQQYFTKYRALEVAGKMTNEHAVEWWTAILDLFVDNHISLTAVERTFLEKASIRPATNELYDLLNSYKIPSTILSAGIRDIIDIWSARYGIHPTLTLSTKFEVDSNGIVVGWDKTSLVHVLNKHETGHPELTTIKSARPNTLVIVDSLDDAAMATGDDTVIRVRILDRRSDDPELATEMARTFELFDALITTGSMEPLCALVDGIARPTKK